MYENMIAIVLASASFFTPTLRTQDGQRISLHGSGPPVLFSSGLFGTMPRRLYTSLFSQLTKELTLVVPEDVSVVTAATVDAVADALAVDKIALLSHSSIDSNILDSPRIKAAVLCDPVVLPNLDWMQGGLVPPTSSPSYPIRVLRAELAYDEETPGIPNMISPSFDENVDVTERTFVGVGHADLLDDTWAKLGSDVIPWMKGAISPPAPFATWSMDARSKTSQLRKEYRANVAADIVTHLLDRDRHPLVTVEVV